MKPLSPHDPFDDLIAAALHGELTPEERTQFEARLSNDPAAQAAYQEAQAMHDLLEKTHKNAQPDPAFEQRMVSGVRRKLQTEQHRETAWESFFALWIGLKRFFVKRRAWEYAVVCVIFALLAGVALGPITNGIKKAKKSAEMQEARELAMAKADEDMQAQIIDSSAKAQQMPAATDNGAPVSAAAAAPATDAASEAPLLAPSAPTEMAAQPATASTVAPLSSPISKSLDDLANLDERQLAKKQPDQSQTQMYDLNVASRNDTTLKLADAEKAKSSAGQDSAAPTVTTQDGQQSSVDKVTEFSAPTETAPALDTRKLIRNAQLDLEVKSFQAAMDQITAMTKAAGGYVDTSNSQKGGNGKLQGTVVVKVLPQNLDAFLLKLRDLGEVQNQSVSTEDVTKDYYDTQARLDNSRRMEEQLQDLLKHANSKVSDLLAVERELGRVRGEIEQMQGQLKLYDFEVQYATVTMQLREKDLNQAAAYLLKEQDDFSLFANDVEGTFEKARQTADDFKAQILVANLVHNSGSDVSAELTVMVAPDQIEPFLTQVRSLGRVANFTRQTQRVAKDGGDSDEPADETKTEKDKVQVHLAIRSDDETRKQVALTVVAKAVDDALDQAKTAALANAGVEILGSSLNKTPQGQSTAQLTVRVPGKDYSSLIAAFNALGRTASLSIQRNDDSGPGANGDDAPVIVSLSLTDDDTPLQETAMSVLATDVDDQAQQIKKGAAAAGVEVKASSFERQPDGTELAQMTFRLPMSKYPAFVESVKALGKVESLSVHRDDRPDQTVTDDTAPAEISLQLHNQGEIVPDNNGLWSTLRQTFGDGAAALFGSVRVIGVVIAFLTPWVFTLVLFAWIGRRIYIWRKK
jgi:type II secretory pathway pseudopilin PulG